MKKGKTISSSIVLDNKWFRVAKEVVEFPNGKIIDDYYVWKNNDVAMVFAMTPDDKVIAVRQYKHAEGEIFLELPAGYIESGEKPEDAVLRELKEETGYTGEDLSLIGKITNNPTKETSDIYVFLLKNARRIGPANLDEGEEIEVIEIPVQEVAEKIYSGEISVTGSISAIFLALRKLGYKW